MKVLFLSEGLDLPETFMIKGVAESGVETHLMLPPSDEKSAFLAEKGIRVHPTEFPSRFSPGLMRAIRRLVVAEGIDIAHALRNNRPVANLLPATLGLNVKRVAYRGTMGNLSRWDPGSRLTYLSRRLHRIVCVSNPVQSYLSEVGVPLERLVTIHKGHDTAWYDAVPAADLRREFGIPEGEVVIGCAANMRPLKGIHVLLECLQRLPPSPRLHFLLVGRVQDERIHDLAAANRTAHRVHLPGYRPDAAALMKSCQIFVMPSLRREGLPRAVIEAMSAGIPAIVTNVGGMMELVEHKVCGRIVRAGSARELARSIQVLSADPALRKQYGASARRRIREKFSVERTVARTLDMYDELMGRPPSRATGM